MKKMLSVILALVMIMSCAFAFPVGAADAAVEGGFSFSLNDLLGGDEAVENFKNAINNYNPENMPAPDTDDIEALLLSGAIDNCNMLGVTIDFLYNSTEALAWGTLYELDSDGNVIFYDENGVQVPQSAGGKPRLAITKGDLALANANLNIYLRRIVNDLYSGFKLYTSENATKLTNLLGNLFYPNYQDQAVVFPGTEGVSEDLFLETVVERSGFGALLQSNWCDALGMEFIPLLTIFGLNPDDVLDSEFEDGHRLAKKLLRATISKFLGEGPLSYMLDILWAYSRAYTAALYQPTTALFALKINGGYIDYEEMKTLDGLLNLIFNDNNPEDTSKVQLLTTPSRRFGIASSKTELFLYLLVYLNLNCRYKNNADVFQGYINDVNSMKISSSDKKKIASIINGLLSGRIDTLVDELGELYVENVEELPNDMWSSIKSTISKFLKKIADFFDNWFKILTGEKDFGT